MGFQISGLEQGFRVLLSEVLSRALGLGFEL